MASEDIGWWVEEGRFAEAINYLFTFFGYESLDTRLPEPENPHLEGLNLFMIDTAMLNAKTGPNWSTGVV
jgi:hypothetical protein